ncbi:MAG: Uncharacterized protein CEO21_41 [Microgenomates group bacterium Gr01-1014_80]|nr:MAG: Uncharacterized protein CEO21_41 [Microgenomates group bacterium Gr01-1014_80]
MKTLIVVLILLSFLQATLIPFDLVLIFLILRAYETPGKENFNLAFGFGLLVSYLENSPLGVYSLIYLGLILAAYLYKKTPISSNLLFGLPLIVMVLSINSISASLLFSSSVQLFPKVFYETLIAIPVYFIVKVWEERFVLKNEVKLRV